MLSKESTDQDEIRRKKKEFLHSALNIWNQVMRRKDKQIGYW